MLSRKDAAIVGAYTGIICGPFSDIHQYIEKVLNRPVFTHELASPDVWAEIKRAATADFMAICAKEDGDAPSNL